jgi:hypothetical protein
MTPKPARPNRIAALDFTKGALVLIMVLYHWLNYFVGPNLDYRYLRFLTPSFIFVTGFLVAHVYFSGQNAADPRLGKRLLIRGIKLLVIFVILNAVRSILLPVLSGAHISFADQLSPGNLWAVGVVGNVPVTSSKLIAFYILVPISYLLLLSAGLSLPYRSFKYSFHVACILFLSGILVLALNGRRSYNLEFITIGLLGAMAGFVSIQTINNFVRHPITLLLGYLSYVVAITAWNVPFPLLAVGVCLSVWAIYLAGLQEPESSRAGRHVILLGKHSLFGYVAQIAILQILSTTFRHVKPGPAVTVISFVAAFALTMLAVEVLERVKSRSLITDRLYKVAFG